MGIARKWVFPIIRIVVFVAIAAALVKLAFFADPSAEASGGATPTGAIVEPQVAATIGTIQNDVELTGTVNADAAIPVRATFGGVVQKLLVGAGQAVAAGTEIAIVKADLVNATTGEPYSKTQKITAGSDGTLSAFSLLVGQTIAVGDTVGQVAPAAFNVTASLAPEQLYRLLDKPADAQVTVTGGPAPFTCGSLTIQTSLAGAGSGGGEGSDPTAGGGSGSGSGTGATVWCRVPAEVTVFAGLVAKVTIAGGVATDVLTIPMTAVQGAAESGVVFVVGADGATEERPVTLGINDGTSVEVTGGLEEGEMILQFVPGAAAGEPGATDGGGGVIMGIGG